LEILSKNLTQNIDDLETKAGISPSKLIQAHGHARSAHCLKHLCQKEA
jgi:NAD-dependent histone deacetylase SIR2/NAD-dependent deacetylase sirtuin 2